MNNPIKNFIEDIKAFRSLKKRKMLKHRERPQYKIPTPGYIRGTEYQVEPIRRAFKIKLTDMIGDRNISDKIEALKKEAILRILRDAEKSIVITGQEDIGTRDIVYDLSLLIGVPK